MGLSIDRHVGQLLIVGFEGTELPSALRCALAEGRIGGLVLFRRNLESVGQVRALLQEAHDAAVGGGQPVPILSVDHEGGRVQRMRAPLTVLPPMEVVGLAADAELAAQLGEAVGLELAALGFNLNFAPCVDLRTHPHNVVIGDRSFGSEPEKVARLAGAFATGMLIQGVVPCAKHFPGHGDTVADSHVELPRVDNDLDTLRRRELVPFQRLIGMNIPAIMTAHILVPAVDTRHPMTLSEAGIGELLRVKMRYRGVVISDDLDMAGVAAHYSTRDMVERAIRAGVDLLLCCRDEARWMEASETLNALARGHAFDQARLQAALDRVHTLKSTWLPAADAPLPAWEDIPWDKHGALVQRILERAARAASPCDA